MSERHKRDWEDLAAADPLWAVLSVPDLRGGGWDVEQFLATGEADVEATLAATTTLGRPASAGRVLDFGCGVGRLAGSFAARFGEYVGLDLSDGMVNQARALHADLPNCTFVASSAPDLAIFHDDFFDLVYSNLVLQHLPSKGAIEGYLAEFLRVVRPDGIVDFQLPASLPLRQRLQPRRRAYGLLRGLGVAPSFLQRRLGLHPIRLITMPEAETREYLESHGGEVALITSEKAGGRSSRRYYVIAAPR